MSETERNFLDPESVSKHLFCSICMEVFYKPLRAPCGHSFCTLCIEQWLRNNKTCPEDRKALRRNQMHFDFILENIIGDHKVACPFRVRGCEEIIPLSLIASHTKICDLNPSNLPEFLAQEPPPQTLVKKLEDYDSSDSEGVGEVPVMSLKMRIFQKGGKKRKLLCTLFDPSTSVLIAGQSTDNESDVETNM